MQSDASSLSQRDVSRRRLLQAVGPGAGLAVAWSRFGGNAFAADATPTSGAKPTGSPAGSQSTEGTPARRTAPTGLDSYLAINRDGSVTLSTGNVEYGQGIATVFMMLVAEELGLDLG